MPQSVQELISKIRKEGLEASQQQAGEIEAEARAKAAERIAEAEEKARRIIADAKAESEKIEQATRASLSQAARNTLLSLRQQINEQLLRIIRQDIREALDGERMAELITGIATAYLAETGGQGEVQVVMSEDKRRLLQDSLLAKLQETIKDGLTIRSADDVGGGFAISFDAGKSWFDFSEEALAQYLAKYVNEYVADLLKP